MSKRGKNEGSIRERDDGVWEARITVGYEVGKRVRKSLYGTTRAEVAAKLSTALGDLQRGRTPFDQRLTVGAYLTRWAGDLDRRVRPTTATRYRAIIKSHLIPGLGRIKLARLSPQHVNQLLAAKLNDGMAPRTVHHLRAVLRSALSDAERWDLCYRNAAKLATPVRMAERTVAPMSPADAHAVLNAVAGTRLEPIAAVGVYCGLRPGETLALRWEDVDLDAAGLRVGATLVRLKGRVERSEPKTKTSTRALPIPPPLVAVLRAHRQSQREARIRNRPEWQEPIPGLVFTTATGRPLNASVMAAELRESLSDAGVRPCTLHGLRHGYATLLLGAGCDLKTVSDLLGHSQISLTADTYASVLPSLRDDAASRLTALMAANSKPLGV